MIDLELIRLALKEDLAGGEDITSIATISADSNASADFVARADGIISGTAMAHAVLREVGLTDITEVRSDGSTVRSGDILISVNGNTRAMLLAERTALNFFCHLSGISTFTSKWVKEVAHTNCLVRDTRKTTPGMRLLEKYAVLKGGGTNHRMSLSDGALVKDNHIAAAGGVKKALSMVRASHPAAEIEVEVDNLQQLAEILTSKPDLVLLDNMSPSECAKAVSLVAGAFKLEASGGITLENAKAFAESGVDFIAIGALTHSSPVFDIGLDLRVE